MTVESRIGRVIRDLRKARNLTLHDLADSVGLSVSHISQIERGISSPSLSALRRIAGALDMRLSQLMLAAEPMSLTADRFVSRKEDRVCARFPGTRVDYEPISREGSAIQLVWLSAPPGSCMEQHERSTAGDECGFVISGHMRVQIGGAEALLGPGDAIFIQSSLKHGWENIGTEDLVMVWSISPPLVKSTY